MAKPSVREKLLDAGLETLHRRGFNGCGVQEITAAAGVPKGSFYNHFESKEALGAAVLERYWEQRGETALCLLRDPHHSPRERLQRYFAAAAENMAKRDYGCGCLIGNLCAELSDQSRLVCDRLRTVLQGWSRAIETCLRESQAIDEISRAVDPGLLAAFLIDAWEGAILRARVEKSGAPLERFRSVTFDVLLPPPSPTRNQP